MRVKRYVVESMPEAVQQIGLDLGGDAIILSTKAIYVGGFLGMFRKKKIEVIAAVDEQENKTVKQSDRTLSKGGVATRATVNVVQRSAYTAGTRATNADDGGNAARVQNAAKLAAASRAIEAVVKEGWNNDSRQAQQPVSPKVSPVMAEQAAVQEAAQPAEQEAEARRGEQPMQAEAAVMQEIRQMKEMIVNLKGHMQATDTETTRPVQLEQLEARLIAQDVQPNVAKELLRRTEEKLRQWLQEHADIDVTDEWYGEQALHILRKQLRKHLHTAVHGIERTTRIVHFVGPTGVGKTTTIAKLAAEQVLRHKRKVGLITSDTYRIAAVEQLKTYATILNIPIAVVFSHADLHRAFDELKDCELILMDTAGRNYRNEMYVSELHALLNGHMESETILVLSMTMKYRDMHTIAMNFAKFKLDKVILTKVDETDSYGAIINMAADFALPLSYMTNGQNVPDDIAMIDIDQMIERILEERPYGGSGAQPAKADGEQQTPDG